MAVPNRYQTVVDVANKYPQAFRVAHTDSPDKWVFIKLLAWELHQTDPKFGLNGKRGNPNDLSMDAINYLGEGVGFDPTRNDRPVTVIDVIGGAGGPDPKPAWQVFNNPDTDRGPGAWVQPQPVPGYQTGDPVKNPVDPVPPTKEQTDTLNELTKVVGALNEVIASHERLTKVVEQQIGRSVDATNELVEQLKINTHYTTETGNALKDAVQGLSERLDRGFKFGAKAGWPVGNINGDLTLKEQG